MKKELLTKKMLAALLALTLAGASLTACGDSSDEDKGSEKASANASSSTEEKQDSDASKPEAADSLPTDSAAADETSSAETPEPEPEPQEIAFEPLPEIKNAPLSSGLKQVYDDVFRMGGYMTVNDFIEQYGDKYDTSSIEPQTLISRASNSYTVYRLDNAKPLTIQVYNYYNKMFFANENEVFDDRLGDLMIINFFDEANGQYEWIAGGYTEEDCAEYDIETIPALFESMGLSKVEFGFDLIQKPGTYTNMVDSFTACVQSDEENLCGVKPVYYYDFIYDAVGKGSRFQFTIQYCTEYELKIFDY